MTKFQLGDTVYRAYARQQPVWITCPECLGSGRLRVILGDDSEVSIACVCCDRGYEGSPGKIQTYKFMSDVHLEVITAIEMCSEGLLRYSVHGYSVNEYDIFATREEALNRAETLAIEHEAEEKKRLGYKEKQHKTWAWHVSYWRRVIRDAKETISRAETRLRVAPKNLKELDREEKL